MRTVFDLSMRRDAWTPSIGSPIALGQASFEDILKATVTGAGTAVTAYEQSQVERQKAATAAAQAQAAAAQSRTAAAANPTVLGMPPLVAGIVGLGLAGVIIAVIMSRSK